VKARPNVRLSNYIVEGIGEVALKAGIDDKTPPDDVWPKLQRYYQDRKCPLVMALERVLSTLNSLRRLDEMSSLRRAAACCRR
jgi:hypothetical protein